MKMDDSQPTPNDGHERRSRWPWILAAGCVLVVLLALRQSLLKDERATHAVSTTASQQASSGASPPIGQKRLPPRLSNSRQTAEEIVAGKVTQFGKSRREIVRAIARRLNKEVPSEVENFFDAIEAGNWDEIDAQWKVMAKHSSQYEKKDDDSAHWPDMDSFWPAVLDAYGVAEQAHLWPAQKLLDYGNAVLDSLRPGMVYVGGTDSGRWIPELLNETSGGEPHIIVTQNAFADGRYLDFMNTLYGDHMATLTHEDSQSALNSYLQDAQKRLQHDQQFPGEPKQVRPDENISIVDGKVQVSSGQVAVIAINEKLFQMLMDKNPDATFAIEQSFAFKSMYPNAAPLGPIMELGVTDPQNTLTAERAAQSVDYWRTTAQQILSDSEAANSPDVRMAYVKMASEQAALFLDRNFTAEAGQAYQIAIELASSTPKVSDYSKWLIPAVENALKIQPNNQQFRDFLKQLQAAKKN